MPHPKLWQPFMILASFVFYAWWDWRFVFLLAASIVANHLTAVGIHRSTGLRVRKALLTLAVGLDLGLLAYFKYAGFLVASTENLLTRLGVGASSSLVSAAL